MWIWEAVHIWLMTVTNLSLVVLVHLWSMSGAEKSADKYNAVGILVSPGYISL
jgi:hypothetical protein